MQEISNVRIRRCNSSLDCQSHLPQGRTILLDDKTMATEEFINWFLKYIGFKALLSESEWKSTEPIDEVNFGRANSSISHQLRYINTVSWIGGNVAVHMRKVDNPKCKVLSLIVDWLQIIVVAKKYIYVSQLRFSCVLGSLSNNDGD